MVSKWAQPLNSKSAVRRAGEVLKNENSSFLESAQATRVLNNWRASHALPLHWIASNVRNTTLKVSPDAAVAQRLKRMPSVLLKLERYPSMGADRIQDYGGVRSIVKNVGEVFSVVEKLRLSRQKHQLKGQKDYIADPDTDGYRGIHLIYAYNSKQYPVFNGMRIEAQIRTEIQHAWATAVETMGLVARQPLKSDAGDPELLEFFKELSSEFAVLEDCPIVPGTITSRAKRVERIRFLESKHSIANRLKAYATSFELKDDFLGDAQYALLKLEGLQMTIYRHSNVEHAESQYSELESSKGADVVLVSASDFKTLEYAYPNYFADTRLFQELLENVLTGS